MATTNTEEARALLDAVLTAAGEELAQIKRQLEGRPALLQRARQLEEFIALGKRLLDDDAP
jgi:ribosome maturation factor RimP